MGNKSRVIGLLILLAVIGIGAAYLLLGGGAAPAAAAALRGYVGGEKIGLLEDPEVQAILADDYGLTLDYAKAGSLDMVAADQTGRDFLFPSSQNALEYYQQIHGRSWRPSWRAVSQQSGTAAITWIWPDWRR